MDSNTTTDLMFVALNTCAFNLKYNKDHGDLPYDHNKHWQMSVSIKTPSIDKLQQTTSLAKNQA